MPAPDDPIQKILLQSERELRSVISDAAMRGDYQAIDRARTAAGRVREILVLLEKGSERPEKLANSSRHQQLTKALPIGRGRGQPRRKNYPRFFVRGAVLHKV